MSMPIYHTFCSYVQNVTDILKHMDLLDTLDILEQTAYTKEDTWSVKSPLCPYYKHFTLNGSFLLKINSSRPPIKPRFSLCK